MIGSVFKKDWVLLWPLAVLVTLIQVALEWAIYKFGFFGVSPVAREIMRLLTPAWYIGVIALAVAVVHEDTIPGVDQDWLIRPLNRTELLLAKLLFVAVTVCVPMLIVNLADELALGFKVMPSFGDALYKEVYMFACLLVPATAIASATRNAVELVILVAGLVLLYVVTVWLSATLFGLDRCPTCDTSVSWLQSLLQHLGLLVGSGAVLAVQYYWRKTSVARVLLAAGVVLLVVVQLPWSVAFTIQTWMGVPIGRLEVRNYRLVEQDPAARTCRLAPSVRYVMDPEHPAAVDPAEPIHSVHNLPEFGGRAVSVHIYSLPFNTCEVYLPEKGRYLDMPLVYTSRLGVLCPGEIAEPARPSGAAAGSPGG